VRVGVYLQQLAGSPTRLERRREIGGREGDNEGDTSRGREEGRKKRKNTIEMLYIKQDKYRKTYRLQN
jgi:hypothetical protein